MSVSTRSSSNKKLIDEDFKNELSNLIKDELISAMNSTKMRKAIASQVK
jgi:predicted nucleic acid-binding protein